MGGEPEGGEPQGFPVAPLLSFSIRALACLQHLLEEDDGTTLPEAASGHVGDSSVLQASLHWTEEETKKWREETLSSLLPAVPYRWVQVRSLSPSLPSSCTAFFPLTNLPLLAKPIFSLLPPSLPCLPLHTLPISPSFPPPLQMLYSATPLCLPPPLLAAARAALQHSRPFLNPLRYWRESAGSSRPERAALTTGQM